MLATLVDALPTGDTFVFEPKYDGIRAIVSASATGVRIWSRAGNEKTAQFPEVVEALRGIVARSGAAVLDGELVRVDRAGEPLAFGALQGRIHLTRAADVARTARTAPVSFVAFDILSVGGRDVRALELVERKRRLESWVGGSTGAVRVGRWQLGDGDALLAEARERTWEGVVAKVAGAPYRCGVRGGEWQKVKLLAREELIIAGWTEPRGLRQRFGALLVGKRQGRALVYAGHVGTGFDARMLDVIADRLLALERADCPFARVPPTNERPHWVDPVLTAEVKFLCWTEAGILRAPVFVGLRDEIASAPVACVHIAPGRDAGGAVRWLLDELQAVHLDASVDDAGAGARVVIGLPSETTRETAALLAALLARVVVARWPGVKVRGCAETALEPRAIATDLDAALDALRARFEARLAAERPSRTKPPL